ncbi:DUF2125 domain-containing protein [Primorskyibacter sedentarius]|uniref:DUF2125 domain-containing protein n=1 Tax=Primorskyibacter sedentarius TaxID=745311 RepID=UPI003EB7FE29
MAVKHLAIAVIVAALGWSAWWFYAANRHEAALEAWFEERRADGWAAEYDSLELRGFPNRLDTTVTGLVLADPQSGTVWQAPIFQILMLSYKPGHAIFVWPHSQTLTLAGREWVIDSDRMRASVIYEPNDEMTLTRANFEAEVLNLASADGSAAMSALNVALAQSGPQSYRLTSAADGYVPGGARPADFPLPESLSALRADLTVELDAPLSRAALETATPRPTRLDLRLAEAIWGGLELKLAGAADVTAAGNLDGRMTLRAVNWREMLKLSATTGTLPESVAATLEQALDLAAGLSGNAETLDLTLDFKRGRTWLGMIPLGPAPQIP